MSSMTRMKAYIIKSPDNEIIQKTITENEHVCWEDFVYSRWVEGGSFSKFAVAESLKKEGYRCVEAMVFVKLNKTIMPDEPLGG